MVPPPPYKDYIPGPDADCLLWLQAFTVGYTASALTSPDPVAGAILVIAYDSALAASTSGATRGPATIQAKDDARAAAVAFGRLGAQAMVAAYDNGLLTAMELTDAGVRVPSVLQTPRLPPAQGPDLLLRSITPGMINLSVQQPGSSSFAKPIGCVGAQLVGGLWSGDPLVPPSEFIYLGLMTRKNFSFDSTGSAGQLWLLAGKWITVRGALSPLGVGINVYAA